MVKDYGSCRLTPSRDLRLAWADLLNLTHTIESYKAIWFGSLNHFLLHLGAIPETMEEWKFLLCLVKSHCSSVPHPAMQNGGAVSNGDPNWPNSVTVENVALLLARVIGPDRALQLLQECGLMVELSERFAKVCEILRIAEKRQR